MLKRINERVDHIYLAVAVQLQTRKVLPILELAVEALAN